LPHVRVLKVDILRSSPESLFEQEITKQMFERILFIFHMRHPATGYVQGMNDLVVPFLVVFLSPYCGDQIGKMVLGSLSPQVLFQVEADCYWCFTILIDKIQVSSSTLFGAWYTQRLGAQATAGVD
jgi:hypothetical protein